jgi:hypothetical protein
VDALDADAALRERWAEFKISVLADLARELLDEARAVDPETELVLLGGARLAPLVESLPWKAWRPGQGYYAEERFAPVLGPWHGLLSRLQVAADRCPPCLAEVTTWPRNAFTKSWNAVCLQTVVSAFLGFDMALFWGGLGYRDRGFGKAFGEKRAWLDAVRGAAADHPEPVGIPCAVDLERRRVPEGMMALARMGFAVYPVPLAGAGALPAVALLGVDRIPDGVPRSGQALILDLAALRALDAAGVGGLSLESTACMFSAERIVAGPATHPLAGLYSTSLTFLQEEDMLVLRSERPLRVLSEYVDSRSTPVSPCVAFDGERKWLLVNQGPTAWERLVSSHKARLLQRAVREAWGGPPGVSVVGAVDTFVFARESGDERVALVVNLSLDTTETWQMHSDRGVRKSYRLDDRGAWILLPVGRCPVRSRQSELPPRCAMLYRFELERDRKG